MKHALYAPNFGTFGDIHHLVAYAEAAEQAGWDGLFLWDHLQHGEDPAKEMTLDPWIAMSAIACATERLRIGALVTPIARRRPWKLARETVSLDHLSNGRLVFGAGIGGDWKREYSGFGEAAGDRLHADMLDEGLEVLTRLWTGEDVNYQGTYYQIHDIAFQPIPVQQPRIPVWVAGVWPGTRPFQRAAKWDGIFPLRKNQGSFQPDEIREMKSYIEGLRDSDDPFDIVIVTETHAAVGEGESADRGSELADLEQAGVTWSLVSLSSDLPHERVHDVINQGPPR